MQKIRFLTKRLITVRWLAVAAAVFGGLYYIWHAFQMAHFRTSFLDEGMYLYKGLLFVNGWYQPYQDYGLWTNHMPLAFLIPGYVQKWFGPGLATARYFMIFLGSLTILGLWLVVCRWSGYWWAALAIWVVALNPAEVKLYTLSISQGLIAVMLVWVLVLTLGIKRPLWQIVLGAVLAGVIMMTRLNMAFVLPVLLLYILWQHGWKPALLSALASGIVALGINALFFPDILHFWAGWLPGKLTPFLDIWRMARFPRTHFPPDETKSLYTVMLYFFLTIRLHFIAFFGVLVTCLLWPSRKGLRRYGRVKAAIFLIALFGILFAAHLYASFGRNYCVSCILLYVSYFDFIGLILLPLAFRLLQKDLSRWRQILVSSLVIVTLLGMGFSAYDDVNTDFAKKIIEAIREVYLWKVLQNVTGASALFLFRQIFTILISLIVLLLVFGLALLIRKRYFNSPSGWRRFVYSVVTLLFILGLVLTPTTALGKGDDFFACGNYDVLESYQEAGGYLRSIVPPGSKVYWDGRIVAIFLYLPGVEVYPPQLNHTHSLFTGGDSDALLRFGYWNDELARKWLGEADYILLEKGHEQDWELQTLSSGNYVQLQSTRKVERCRWQSVIDVYQRVKP